MNKRTLALLFKLTIIVSSAFSQTEKGNFLIGGSSQLNYSQTTSTAEYSSGYGSYGSYGDPIQTSNKDVSKEKSFNIKPTIGYFVAEKLALTFSFDYAYNNNPYVTTKMFEYVPGLIYYFGDSNIRPFLSAEAGFGTLKNTSNNSVSHLYIWGFGITGGTAIFLTKSVSFDPAIVYSKSFTTSKYLESYNKTSNTFSFQAGITVYLQRQ
jgi:outer membrane protein